MYKFFKYFIPFYTFFLLACANHSSDNLIYTQTILSNSCSDSFFEKEKKKIDNLEDPIYVGINVASIARYCNKFELSNEIFDKTEDAYKFDVDLKDGASKTLKAIGTTLTNDSLADYDGTLYERIMLNIYKGLNFMSLRDFENARVEFNRALYRQDRAKEYFAKDIAELRKEFDEQKQNKKDIESGIDKVSSQYEHLLREFKTSQNFINPYATYISSVFFFLERDYSKAADLFKEIAVTYSNNAEIKKEFNVFNQYANSSSPEKLKKYIFVVYENGLGAGLYEMSFTIPYSFNDSIITTSFALPVLKARPSSFHYIKAGDKRTVEVANFDDIIATEFKILLPAKIFKAIVSSISKTAVNMVVSNNAGGWAALASSIINSATTRADVRYWSSLPKNAQVLMVENNGYIELTDNMGGLLYKNDNIDKSKNTLLILRSFSTNSTNLTYLIQEDR